MRTVMTVAALLLFAGPAEAATSVSREDETLLVRAAPARINAITVAASGDDLVVSDSGDTTAAGSGCRSESSNEVRCAAGSIEVVFVEAGSRNDDVAVNTAMPSLIHGDTGDDTLTGGFERDRLVGEEGNDTLEGRAGNDRLNGGLGGDRITGGSGDQDAVRYREKDEPVRVDLDGEADDGTAGEGDDVNFEVEEIYGGSAGDALLGSSGPNVLDGGRGNDRLNGLGANDFIAGGAGDDRLSGADGDDTLEAGPGDDTIGGQAGDDVHFASPGSAPDGADAFSGGDGRDTVTYRRRSTSVTHRISLNGVANDGHPGEGDNNRRDVEDAVGTFARDILTGSGSVNHLNGGPGRDILNGLGSPDSLVGGSRDDILNGGGDQDLLRGGEGDDTLNGDGGLDTLDGGSDDDTLNGGVDNDFILGGDGPQFGRDRDVLNGGPGRDLASYLGRTEDLTIDLDGRADDGATGEGDDVGADMEDVAAGAGDDTLIGSEADNLLTSCCGNDRMTGLGGDDVLGGGTGDDLLIGGTGNDTLSDIGGDDVLAGRSGDDRLIGRGGDDGMLGGDGNDRLEGEDGVLGNDRLNGSDGSDACTADSGDEVLGCEGRPAAARLAQRPPPPTVELPDDLVACDYPCPTATIVTSPEALRDELARAQPGAVIQVPGGLHLNLDGVIPLTINPGVTLQGTRGARRSGAELEVTRTDVDRAFVIGGDGATIRDLRLRGPSTSRDGDVAKVNGIVARDRYVTTITGNEMYGWTSAAISVRGDVDATFCVGTPDRPHRVRIARNHIHHNQRPGAGYGVVAHDGANPLVEDNTFDWNRHAIAADGDGETGYFAQYNYVLSGGAKYQYTVTSAYGQHFDMHGSGEDGYGGVAGDDVSIVRNTVHGEQEYGGILGVGQRTRPVYRLRGRPCGSNWLYGNVLVHEREEAVRATDGGEGRYTMVDNRFDTDTSWDLGVGDFDRDGRDDLLQATGAAWYYSSGGTAEWRMLRRANGPIGALRFGDFDGDGDTDVFTAGGGAWRISRGGTGGWETLAASPYGLEDLRFGDFDGDGSTDVFRASGSGWRYSPRGAGNWLPLAGSAYGVEDVRFGNFDGDAVTDVFGIQGGRWAVSYDGRSAWQRLNSKLASDLDTLVFEDFDGDGRTDIAQTRYGDLASLEWRVSRSGTEGWTRMRSFSPFSWDLRTPLHLHWLGEFDSTQGADALRYQPSGAPLGSEGVRLVRSSGARSDYEPHSRNGMR